MRAPGSEWRALAASGQLTQFVLLCLGIFLHAADTLATATIMPAAVGEIGGVSYINWTISLYQIGSIVAGAAAGALSRRAGLRGVLLGSASVYGIGCVISALSPGIGVMLAGRLVQGFGGGMMVALSYVAVQALFPEHLWTRLLAILSTIWGAASLLGPLIGGLFGDAGLWRWAFWFFAALAALLVLAAARFLREPAALPAGSRAWSWPPLLVLFAGTLAIAEAGELSELSGAVAAALVGVALLAAAAVLDGRGRNRLLPTEALQVTHRLGAGFLMVFSLSAASTGFWAYGPLILKSAFGTDLLFSGLLLAGESLAWTLCTIAVAGAPPRWARALIGTGVTTASLGTAGLVLAMPAGFAAGIVICVLLQGAGFGLSWPFLVARVIALARPDERDLAAGAAPTAQRIGYAVGAAAAGIAANAAGFAIGASPEAAHAAAFWVFASFLPLVLVALLAAARFVGAGSGDDALRRPNSPAQCDRSPSQ